MIFLVEGRTLNGCPEEVSAGVADHIAFFGAASTNLPDGAIGTATVTYTDGTTQDIQIALSDWGLDNGTYTPRQR